jgi:TIR domain
VLGADPKRVDLAADAAQRIGPFLQIVRHEHVPDRGLAVELAEEARLSGSGQLGVSVGLFAIVLSLVVLFSLHHSPPHESLRKRRAAVGRMRGRIEACAGLITGPLVDDGTRDPQPASRVRQRRDCFFAVSLEADRSVCSADRRRSHDSDWGVEYHGEMAARIFISYRRKEDGAGAGRVHDRLEREFGSDLLFMDVDAIPRGANFAKVLRDAVSTCDALLAVIGPNWLDAVDDDGNRKLDHPDDFVRVELGIALARDIPVVPILLDGAKIPKAARLPDDLKELSFRSGLEVRHTSFRADMDKLIKWVNSQASKTQTKPETKIPVDVPHSSERRVKFTRSDGLQLLINPNVVLVVSRVIKPQATQLRLTDHLNT